MDLNYQMGATPLIARQNLPLFTFLLILAGIFGIIIVISIFVKKHIDYKKSPAFLEKEKNRLTSYKDILKIKNEYFLTDNKKELLWEICRISKCRNFYYLLKSCSGEIEDIFHEVYKTFKKKNVPIQKRDDFFTLLYKMQSIIAEIKTISSTKAIPISAIIFYITETGEQLPLYLVKNTKDGFFLEIPEFLFNSNKKPKTMERCRFTYKTNNGLSYNFVARAIRYDTSNDQQTLMVVSHTEDLICQVQRHYKREYLEETCMFSPVQINKTKTENNNMFIYSTKEYKGKVTNISAGGCCIQTNLPIRENQHMSISFPSLEINGRIIGVIKRTRKLQNGMFALHIQFINITLETKVQIYEYVNNYTI